MGSLELSNLETADLCRELALLLHSGVSAADGLYLMAEEETDSSCIICCPEWPLPLTAVTICIRYFSRPAASRLL